MLVAGDWTAKVGDFGLSREADVAGDSRQSTVVLRNPRCAACLARGCAPRAASRVARGQRPLAFPAWRRTCPPCATSRASPRLASSRTHTCRWLAPEVLDGERPRPASDVYSFGVVRGLVGRLGLDDLVASAAGALGAWDAG